MLSHGSVMHCVITRVKETEKTEVNFSLFHSRYAAMNELDSVRIVPGIHHSKSPLKEIVKNFFTLSWHHCHLY